VQERKEERGLDLEIIPAQFGLLAGGENKAWKLGPCI
jgi:hypothetical protein